MPDEAKFFKDLGARIRELRETAGYSQEDMITHDFSVRYWQKVEAGKPITLRTLLRICRLFSTPMHEVVHGLDKSGPGKQAVTRKATARRRQKKSSASRSE